MSFIPFLFSFCTLRIVAFVMIDSRYNGIRGILLASKIVSLWCCCWCQNLGWNLAGTWATTKNRCEMVKMPFVWDCSPAIITDSFSWGATKACSWVAAIHYRKGLNNSTESTPPFDRRACAQSSFYSKFKDFLQTLQYSPQKKTKIIQF